MDRSYRYAIVARGSATEPLTRRTFDALNADAAFLLDTIDDVDAAPTQPSHGRVRHPRGAAAGDRFPIWKYNRRPSA